MAHSTSHGPTTTANYELRLYEGQSHFDVIYGTVASGNTSATAGVQKTTPPLTSTSATARVVRRPAGKATSCKAAARHRRLRLAQVQRQLPLLLPLRQLRPRLHRRPRPQQQRLAHHGNCHSNRYCYCYAAAEAYSITKTPPDTTRPDRKVC